MNPLLNDSFFKNLLEKPAFKEGTSTSLNYESYQKRKKACRHTKETDLKVQTTSTPIIHSPPRPNRDLPNFGIISPVKVDGFCQIRTTHLKKLSPHHNHTKIAYGTDPLSKRVIEFKQKNGITTGRNVAIVIAKLGEEYIYTIGTTDGPPSTLHGELVALDLLPKTILSEDIVAIYSERYFCKRCESIIKNTLAHVAFFYSTDYDQKNPQKQRSLEKLFKEVQNAVGVTSADAKTKSPKANPGNIFDNEDGVHADLYPLSDFEDATEDTSNNTLESTLLDFSENEDDEIPHPSLFDFSDKLHQKVNGPAKKVSKAKERYALRNWSSGSIF